MPFDSENFIHMWQQWKQYKADQHKFKYAAAHTEQAALNTLVKLSNGNEKTAIEIIMQSMAQGWKGFFELNNNKNGNHSNLPNWSERGKALDAAVDEYFKAKRDFENSPV
jgi:hypothetical protein